MQNRKPQLKNEILIVIILLITFLVGCSPKNDLIKSSSIIEDDISSKESQLPLIVRNNFSGNYILLQNGDVYSWGRNDFGCLGQNIDNGMFLEYPKKIMDIADIKTISVASTGYTVGAIDSKGQVLLWGQNIFNLTCNSDSLILSKPTKVNFSKQAKDIALSSTLICILDEDGNVYQGGFSGEEEISNLEHIDYSNISNQRFEQILINNVAQEIVCGDDFIGILSVEGDVFIWKNSNIVKLNEENKFTKIGANGKNLVALSTDGELYAIGNDYIGIIGLKDYFNYENFIPITKLHHKVKNFYMSGSSIIAICIEGHIYQWGYNISNNITNLPDEIIFEPIKKDINTEILDCYPGTFTSTIIDTDFNIWVWGSNYNNLKLSDDRGDSAEPLNITSYLQKYFIE